MLCQAVSGYWESTSPGLTPEGSRDKVLLFWARKAGKSARTGPAQDHLSSGLPNKPCPVSLSSSHVARETAELLHVWGVSFCRHTAGSIRLGWFLVFNRAAPVNTNISDKVRKITWLHLQKEPSQLYKTVLISTLLHKLFQILQLQLTALGKARQAYNTSTSFCDGVEVTACSLLSLLDRKKPDLINSKELKSQHLFAAEKSQCRCGIQPSLQGRNRAQGHHPCELGVILVFNPP